MAKPHKRVFQDTIEHSQKLHGIDRRTAMADVQIHFDKFMDRNQELTRIQDSHANSANIQLISHFALLATLSLTVVGFLFQSAPNLSDTHKTLVLMVLICQALSLTAGAADYILTILFHRKWSQTYYAISQEVQDKFKKDELQYISDLSKIESKHVKDNHRTSPIWVTITMVVFCLIGVAALILLFYFFLFDFPLN